MFMRHRYRSWWLALILLAVAGPVSAQQIRQQPQAATLALSAWTSATALNATQTIFSPGDAGFEAIAVQLTQTTTLSAGAVTFEVSFDNSNWITIPADAVHDPTSTTWATVPLPYTVQASTNKLFVLHTKGWQALRVKLSTQITGSGSVTPNVTFLPTVPVGDVVALSPTAANFNVTSLDTPPTLTKGTQGSAGYSTQDLKDAGRTHLTFSAIAAAAGSTGTETAITLTKSSGTSATSTGASFVVTSGKRFRITHLSVATRGNATATIQTTTFALRINTAGAVTTTSTPIVFQARSATPATASAWDRYILPIPDGFEILGDGTLQFGITANATYTTNAPTWDVNILGFEY
jgi:hypothetical protein